MLDEVGQSKVVGHEQQGAVGIQDLGDHAGGQLSVELSHDLVGEQQGRLVRHRHRERHALGLATGQLARSVTGTVADVEAIKQVPWAGIILDEAQNVKNPETRQARSSRAVMADYRIALTGTPVENNVGELWSVMEFLNPGFLGTRDHFRKTFFIPIQTGRDPSMSGNLRRLTAPFLLRRLKTDTSIIADLPEKMEAKVYCTLTKEQADLYEKVAKDAYRLIETADGIGRRGVILATLSKLKQVCNHPAHYLGDGSPPTGRSGKLARLHAWLAARGQSLEQFDSTGYSDSINDLPLLGAVDRPVAVNADARLAEVAAARGWQTLSLRC